MKLFLNVQEFFIQKTGGLTNKWTHGKRRCGVAAARTLLTSPEVFLTDMKTSPTDSFLMIDACELILHCFYPEMIFLASSRLLVWKRLCSVRNSSLLPGSFVYELNRSLHRVIPQAKRPWFTFQSIMPHLYCVKLKYHKVARNFELSVFISGLPVHEFLQLVHVRCKNVLFCVRVSVLWCFCPNFA